MAQNAEATFGSIASGAAAVKEREPVILKRSDFKVITMKPRWRIHAIQEVHEASQEAQGECALVCEDDDDSQLVFFYINELKEGQCQFKSLTQTITDERRKGVPVADYIKDYRSLLVNMGGTGEYRQCGIALRASGGVDFYFDFRLVETSEAEAKPMRLYTAIDMDFTYLHFKCVQEQ